MKGSPHYYALAPLNNGVLESFPLNLLKSFVIEIVESSWLDYCIVEISFSSVLICFVLKEAYGIICLEFKTAKGQVANIFRF